MVRAFFGYWEASEYMFSNSHQSNWICLVLRSQLTVYCLSGQRIHIKEAT